MNRTPILRALLPMTLAGLAAACAPSDNNGAYVGYVEAEYIYVAAPQAGWLQSVEVREGDMVDDGVLLFALDQDQQRAIYGEAAGRAEQAAAQARDIATGARSDEIARLEAQLEEARARHIQARAEKDRWLPLVAEGNASAARGDQVQADYNAALARVKAAQEAIAVAKLAGRDAAREAAAAGSASAIAALDQAKWTLDQRRVHAQTGGRVEEIFQRKGEFIRAGSPVVAILPPGNIKIRFFIPQAELTGFAVGGTVEIAPDGGDVRLNAVISHIASEAEFTPPVIYSAGSREKTGLSGRGAHHRWRRLAAGPTSRCIRPVTDFAPPDLAINVRGLVKRFGDKVAVDGVDIQMPRGEVWGFLGPNGSGKTTTIRMICGLLQANEGEGECLGYDIARDTDQIKLSTGYMTQKFSFWGDLTIRENIEFVARLYQMPERKKTVDDTLEKLGLTDRQHQLAGALSGGWKQRMAPCCRHHA